MECVADALMTLKQSKMHFKTVMQGVRFSIFLRLKKMLTDFRCRCKDYKKWSGSFFKTSSICEVKDKLS